MRFIPLLGLLILFAACSTSVKKGQVPSSPSGDETAESSYPAGFPDLEASVPHRVVLKDDPKIIEKADAVFIDIYKNDDKSAKLAYGRSYRFLPAILQFAFDLRFNNFEHALKVLPDTPYASDQKDFWKRILEKHPKDINNAICEDLKSQSDYPQSKVEVSSEEAAWVSHFNDLSDAFVKQNNPHLKELHPYLDQEIDKISCHEKTANPETGNCGPIPNDIRDEILKDSFFDQLHNMKRRDTRFILANQKNAYKTYLYFLTQRYVSPSLILKLAQAQKATPYARQMHFLRRMRGVARDMRVEDIFNRAIADRILNDKVDGSFTLRLTRLLRNNELAAEMLRSDYELASCQLNPNPPEPSIPSIPAMPAVSASPAPVSAKK